MGLEWRKTNELHSDLFRRISVQRMEERTILSIISLKMNLTSRLILCWTPAIIIMQIVLIRLGYILMNWIEIKLKT